MTQFAKDMGQTAQLVASKKLQGCTNAEAFNNQCEIPNVASGHKGIHSVSSLDFLKNSKGSQNLRGEMGIPGDKLNVEKASTLDINDDSSGGYVQTGAYGEKSIQAVGEGGLSVKQDIHQGIGCPNFTAWNTACSNSNGFVSNSIKKAKNVLMAGMSSKENSGNHKRKFVEDGNEGDNKPYQGGIPNFSTAWNTGSDRDKSISSSINRGKNFQMEHRSTGSKPDKFILSSVNKGKNFQVPEAASSNPENFEGGISNSSTTLNTGSDLDKIISSSTNKGKNFQMVEATSSTPNRTPVDTHLKFMEAVREDANKSCQGGIFNFSTTWNTGSDQDKFILSSINNGKNFEMAVATFSNPKKTPVDLFTKILEAVREGNTKSCQGGTPNFSAWNTDNKRDKFISSSINQGRNVQMAEATSSNPKKALVDPRINFFQSMEKGRTSKFDLPDQGIQSSNSAPALSGAGNSVFSTENEQGKQSIPSATDERKNVPITAVNFVSILENVDQIIGKTVQSLRAGDAVFRGHMANEGRGYCSIPLLVGGNSNLSSPLNTGGNPGQFNSAVIKGVNVQMPGMNPPNLIAAALNKGMNIQIPRMSSSGPMMQGTLSARGRGVPPSAPQQQRFPPPITRPSWNQARPMPGLNIPFPGGGSNQLPAVGNVRGTNYGSQFLQAGQTLNRHLPMHLRPQPIFTSIMQMQRRPLQVGSAGPQCIFSPRVQMQTRPPQVNLPGPVPVFSSSMQIQPRPSQVNLAGPHPIFASPIQMQPRPPQADLAGQNASSWQRGHGATAANGQQAIVNTTAMRGRYPNRDPRQNLSTGVPQHNNHGQTS